MKRTVKQVIIKLLLAEFNEYTNHTQPVMAVTL